eukprot:COSAG02_NODE_21975_length_768_cov_0.588939_1_plen_20_part_10
MKTVPRAPKIGVPGDSCGLR